MTDRFRLILHGWLMAEVDPDRGPLPPGYSLGENVDTLLGGAEFHKYNPKVGSEWIGGRVYDRVRALRVCWMHYAGIELDLERGQEITQALQGDEDRSETKVTP